MKLTRLATYIYTLLSCCLMLLQPAKAMAFDTDIYAASSVLASGKWVKVSVPSSGLYTIPTASLRNWGFSNPSARAVGQHCIGSNILCRRPRDMVPPVIRHVDTQP